MAQLLAPIPAGQATAALVAYTAGFPILATLVFRQRDVA